MEYIPGLYSVTAGGNTPATISVDAQRRTFEAWVATLDPLVISTGCAGDPIDVRVGDRRFRFVLHAESGIPAVNEADPCISSCTFPDGSHVQLFNCPVEPAQLPFTPRTSGQHFRLDILSAPMSVTLDQHATLPRYAAFVRGFLNGQRELEVYILTTSAVHREQLIASIATMSLVNDGPSPDARHERYT